MLITNSLNEVLLVVYKPDGVRRLCSAREVEQVLEARTAVLHWLCGGDPESSPHSQVVEEVARKTALQAPRCSHYDVVLWARQAAELGEYKNHPTASAQPMAELGTACFCSFGLNRLVKKNCWLNRPAIEIIYRDSLRFRANRELLTQRLLDGPVLIELWTGENKEVCLATKFILRQLLSNSSVTNLIHIEICSHINAEKLLDALSVY